jgi:hypothetical protein
LHSDIGGSPGVRHSTVVHVRVLLGKHHTHLNYENAVPSDVRFAAPRSRCGSADGHRLDEPQTPGMTADQSGAPGLNVTEYVTGAA